MLKDRNGERVFPEGAFWNFLWFLFILFFPALILHALTRDDRPVMPPDLVDHGARCILTDDPYSCHLYNAAKHQYPMR